MTFCCYFRTKDFTCAGFGFWAKADSKDCVTAKNLPEYWKQVIMQVNLVNYGYRCTSSLKNVFESFWKANLHLSWEQGDGGFQK